MTKHDIGFKETSIESGAHYGYPECCIKEFVKTPPSQMYKLNRKEANIRFKAGHINGVFSGFIPCLKHAKQIRDKEITLVELIDYQRRTVPLAFPFDWSLK